MPKKITKTEYIWQEVEQLFVTLQPPLTRASSRWSRSQNNFKMKVLITITLGAQYYWSVMWQTDWLRLVTDLEIFPDVLYLRPLLLSLLTLLGSKRPGLLERWETPRHGQHRQPGGDVWQDSHGGADQLRQAFQWNHLQQRSHRSVQLYLRQAADWV